MYVNRTTLEPLGTTTASSNPILCTFTGLASPVSPVTVACHPASQVMLQMRREAVAARVLIVAVSSVLASMRAVPWAARPASGWRDSWTGW